MPLLTESRARVARQFGKYFLAGLLATAVDVATFYLVAIAVFPSLAPGDPAAVLLGFKPAPISESLRSTHYVWGKVIAFMLSCLTAYIANILWVFTPGRHSKAVEVTLFFVVSAMSFFIGTALGWLLIRLTGLPTTYAYIANGVASLSLNFVCRKFIVFKG
ncbi:MAG: GtrA family protein [Elusimicrobia bacterium]|nr:GtrA family protein [Elusimicrobiota bacterium]